MLNVHPVHLEYQEVSNGSCRMSDFWVRSTEICQEMLANLKETFKYVKQVHVPESMNLPRRALEGNLGKWMKGACWKM